MAKRILVLSAALLMLVLLAAILCRTAPHQTPSPAEITAEPVQASPDTTEAREEDSMAEAQSEATLSTQETTVQELGEQLLREYSSTDGHISGEMLSLIAAMRGTDPAAAERWTDLFETWEQVNCSMEFNGSLADVEIPEDGSLCIVVLGYRLRENGNMTTELRGRLETALACAEEYPNAYIAVTGGGTATENRSVTEAGNMAAWLLEHGIAQERIIIENKSLTTVENALFTGELLQERGIRAVIVVTSDYHIRRSCMVFTAQALFGDAGYRVVANRAFDTGWPESRDPDNQLAEVRGVLLRLEKEKET